MSRRSFLVFSGYNLRAVVAFCRFAEARRIPISIVAAGPSDAIYRTAYARYVVVERDGPALVVEQVERIVERARDRCGAGHFDLLPSSEYLNRFFLKWRDRFERIGVAVPLCERGLYERISDKSAFCALCSAAGLDVPDELPPDIPGGYPLVIKPRRYFGARGEVQSRPILVFDATQHRTALDRFGDQDLFFQEYVQGDSYYLLYYVSRDGRDVCFSQRNLIQQAGGLSIVGAVPSSLHLEPLGRAYLELLVGVGFRGLVMVEIRRSGDRNVMIEANPRLWGPSQLFVDCGVPLFDAFAADLGYLEGYDPDAVPQLEGRRYFWTGGMVADLAAGRELAYHGYSPAELAQELHLWLRSDVYLRSDTLGHYHEELQ